MITLYSADTPHGLRAALILEECGLDYTLKMVDLMKGEQREASFLKLNPRGQIPVVVDTQEPEGPKLVLAQSAAILLHYAQKTGVLWPNEPGEQALALQWLMHAASDMSSIGSTLFSLEHFVPEKSESTIEYFIERLEPHLDYIEARLQSVEYLAGPLSIADLSLFPVVKARLQTIRDIDDYEAIEAWMARIAARPAVVRAVEKNQGS
ncbi:MAG: glutathione S-transferase family protein [Kiloniellales bacterium]